MKRSHIIAIAITAAIFAVGALVVMAARSTGTNIPTYTVTAGMFDRRATAEGYFEAEKATPVVAPMQARGPLKIAWLAEDQTLVKQGDVLVRFDPTDFEMTLESGTNERQKSVNNITKLEVETGATTRNLARDSRQAQAELESARTFSARDEEIYSRYQVIESGIEEELAGEKREYAERVQQIRAELARADRDLEQIQQRKADMKISQAQSGLSALVATAPHDGLIVFKRDWRGELPRVGGNVWSGSPLGEIPLMTKMRAQLFVLEADAGDIAAGQKAIVRADSNPTVQFNGTVEQIDKIAKPRTRGVPVQYFGVRLTLDKYEPALMKPGARLRATIQLARNQNAITIPRQALFEKGGAKLVYVKNGDAFMPRPVAIGVFSAGKVLIASGLKAGEVIALEDPTRDASETTPKKASA